MRYLNIKKPQTKLFNDVSALTYEINAGILYDLREKYRGYSDDDLLMHRVCLLSAEAVNLVATIAELRDRLAKK